MRDMRVRPKGNLTELRARLMFEGQRLWSAARQLVASMIDRRCAAEPPLDPILELAKRLIPAGSRVLVVTKGDTSLLRIRSVDAQHFPQAADGNYAGHHPATGAEAISHLENLRGRGAAYLVFPAFSLWWLGYYTEFREHLDQKYQMLAFEEAAGLIYALNEGPRGLVDVTVRPTEHAQRTWSEKAERRWESRGAPGGLELVRAQAIERRYEVDAKGFHLLSGAIVGTEQASPRAALVSVRFLDPQGQVIPGVYRNFSLSDRADIGWYRYLATTAGPQPSTFLCLLDPPEGTATVEARFYKWDRHVPDRLFLSEEPVVEPTSSELMRRRCDGAPADDLRVLATLQQAEGELTACVETLKEIARLTGTGEARRALASMAGKRRELDVRWRPVLPNQSIARPSGDALRICHLFKVSYPFESSGGAIRNLNVVKFQRKVGLDPYAVTPLGYPQSHGTDEFAEVEDVADVPHIRLRLPGQDDPDLPLDQRLQFDAIATAGVIRDRGAHIIHAASGFRGYELALKGLALARHFNLPLVYEVRSLHEHLWGKPVGEKLEREWTRLRMAQENRCMQEATVVVTLADAMKEILCSRGIPESKIVVIPNAVDDAEFVPAPPDRDLKASLGLDGGPIVGYISNISHREGHDVLLRAMAELQYRRSDLRCLFVGDGSERRNMELLAADLGIRDRVVFTGEVDHAEIRRYYGIIDVFVVPRRSDYAADYVTPLKPFEALALQRGLVMSDLPSLREIVGDEERGLLFRPEEPSALAAQIETLFNRPELRALLAERGRSWVLRERTWLRNAQRYRKLYSDVRDQTGARLK